jgi:hypothetical protein
VDAPWSRANGFQGLSSAIYCISYKYADKAFPIDLDIFPIYDPDMSTSKQRRGRPRKSSGKTKSISILLRLDPGEKQGFGEAANIAGIPLAVWIRERLRRVATRELEEAGRDNPFLS